MSISKTLKKKKKSGISSSLAYFFNHKTQIKKV